jgi:hypothetical protein
VTGDGDHITPDPDGDAVRRLLADARHTAPIPADVAARMDDVLAGLAQGVPADSGGADPTPSSPPDPVVVSLAAQRRRRAAGILVAAAAIVVGGVVVAQHIPGPGSESGAATAGSAQDRAEVATGAQGRAPNGSPLPSPGASTPRNLSGDEVAKVRHGRVVVRPQHFTSDAYAALRLLDRSSTASETFQLRHLDESCAVAAPADGKHVNATYERAPAVLVFHRPESSTQVVDLFVCGSKRPVRSATLPRP